MFLMENNTTVIAVSATAIVIVISYLVYTMGCNVSSKIQSSSSDNNKKTKAKQVDDKEKYPAGPLTVFFGSQTGTAEGFARMIMEETKEQGFNTKVVDLEDFEPEMILTQTKRAIFLMATYGEGEPTDNAVSFIKWLKNGDGEIEDNGLSSIQFSVFGLGNKQYEHYNAMGKLVNKKMEELGAVCMFEYGEGDDDASLEEDFEAWKTNLIPALYQKFHPSANGDNSISAGSMNDSVTTHKVKLQFVTEPAVIKDTHHRLPSPSEVEFEASKKGSSKINTSTKHFFTAPRAKVLINRELRNNKNNIKEIGSTRHIEIDLTDTNVNYFTADNLAIIPENDENKVKELAKSQGYDLTNVFNIKPVSGEEDNFKLAFPTPCTIEEALTLFLDIQGPAKLNILKHLVSYIKDPNEKDWLLSVLDKNNRDALHSLHNDAAISIYDLLTNQLKSCKIPWDDFLHIVPYIQPRYYTISSSSSCYPTTVHITVSITEYQLKNGKEFIGLTSNYITKLSNNNKASNDNGLGLGDYTSCRIFVRPSTFRLPKQLETPIIMIGPGTGLAPMRALLQERKYLSNNNNNKMGDNILYFGCRTNNTDFIYKDELNDYVKEGVLTSLYTAFSREKNKPKTYVQNLMKNKKNAEELINLITNNNAYIYVCGATAMGNDVNHCLLELLQEYKICNDNSNAINYLKDLHDNGRYVQELWTA